MTEGGISIGSIGAEDANINIAGRDVKVGLDVGELVEALKAAFPANDPRPEALRHLLDEYRQYHEQLHEWKELHNQLDMILTTFAPFAAQVDRADFSNKPAEITLLVQLWRPAAGRVDELLEWAPSIRYIGKPYHVDSGGTQEGEKWAMEIAALRRDLEEHLNARVRQPSSDGGQFLQRLLGGRPEWWRVLFDLSHTFEDVTAKHMHLADKQLRQTATDLYILSERAWGRSK